MKAFLQTLNNWQYFSDQMYGLIKKRKEKDIQYFLCKKQSETNILNLALFSALNYILPYFCI